MPATKEDDDGDDVSRTPIYMRSVELHLCVPAREGNPKTGAPIAIVTFVRKGQFDKPIMLRPPDIRRLLASLVTVLNHHEDPLGQKLMMLFFPDGKWPTDPSDDLPRSKGKAPKHRATPSVRTDTPRKPVGETDVWQMIRMLQNVEDHETFMRLIGVPEMDIAVDPQIERRMTPRLNRNHSRQRPAYPANSKPKPKRKK